MVRIELHGHEAILAEYRGYHDKTARAMVRAMNRGINAARTLMVREIARDTGLKQRDVRDALRLHEASLSRPVARLAAGLKRIPLYDFNARGPRPSRGRGHGVTYRIGRGRGRVDDAFIAQMRSGHVGVFKRVAGGNRRGPAPHRSQLPIVELFGPSLGHVFGKHRAAGFARGLEIFTRNFDHEMAFRSGSGDAGGSE